jgi:hypothetical protein
MIPTALPNAAPSQMPSRELELNLASPLARHVMFAWREACAYKGIEHTQELLRCDRQRKGVYEPEVAASIKKGGGSDIYMMLSDIKARAASSWIKDVIASAGERPYDLKPSSAPSIEPEMMKNITEFVMLEAQSFIEEGQVHPEAMRARVEEIRDRVMMRLREEAQQSADRMSGVIGDQLKEGNFKDALDAFIDDFVTYPTAILKGPVVRKRPSLAWGPGARPIVSERMVRETYRVSPYDIFPSPSSDGPNDGYIIERHRLTISELQGKIGLPGYNAGEIAAAISKYSRTGIKYNEQGDYDRAQLENKNSYGFFADQKMETLEYWGPVRGSDLKSWGFKGKLDDFRVYEVNAWLVGNHVIRAVMNPDPLGRRPYHTASWRRIAGSFWGESLMKIVRDVQRICNNAARALCDNMSIASGPQVDVAVDRLPDGYEITDLYPWKIHQSTSDRTGGGQPAVRFYQPSMHAEPLLNVYGTFMRQADEVTGIPNYIYGSAQASGAGRTASGLAMLMDNAAKGIKMAIGVVDRAISGVVLQLYTHNMLYHPDPFIKGDFALVPRGALGVLVKEQLRQARNEFMAATANPIDLEIMGIEGRAYLLRERAEDLQLNTDRIVPSIETVLSRQREKAQQMAEQQAAMGQQGLGPDGQPQQGPPGQPGVPQPPRQLPISQQGAGELQPAI